MTRSIITIKDKYAGLPKDWVKRYNLDEAPDDALAQYRRLRAILMSIEDCESERAVEIRTLLNRLQALIQGTEYMGIQMMSDDLLGED